MVLMGKLVAVLVIKISPQVFEGLPVDVTVSQSSVKRQHPERNGSQVAFPGVFCGVVKDPTIDALAKRNCPS